MVNDNTPATPDPRLLSLLPQPTHIEGRPGAFRVSDRITIGFDASQPQLQDAATRLARWTRETLNRPSEANPTAVDQADVFLSLETGEANPESYRLRIQPDSVYISAPFLPGIGHGIQTLRQLLPTEGACTLPCADITDEPRFPWRGLLLDCCRHFVDPPTIHRTLELLAYHKMNRFHWHLTEDQGWRIEIRGHPELTRIGAWRQGSNGPYGGFYSQDDVREIVEHAERLGITVVPEIEMPGHAIAALASYPEFSCTGGPFEVETRWGIFDDVYCAGNDATLEFLESVLSEVLELFPGPFIHVGGDECPKARWRACPKCQARITNEGLRDEDHLQSWFLDHIGHFLRQKGRRMIGWDEILEGGLPTGAVVQSWRGFEGAVAAVRAGHDAILSPTSHAYFDYGLDQIDLARVYEFEPIPPGLTEPQSGRILGGECNMWTERAPQETLDSKIFPRLCAMAERLWSPARVRDFENFRSRMGPHGRRLSAMGVEMGEGRTP